jgi:formyltetrahydrofolate deformylase
MRRMNMASQYLLVFSCKDTFGIIADVTGFLSEKGAFIRELSEFGDPNTGRFFMRCVFECPRQTPDLSAFSQQFSSVANKFEAQFQFLEAGYRPKTVILVSKWGHCLNDLLYRWHSKTLPMDIAAVVSNHTDLERQVKYYDLPFVHLPVSAGNKGLQEEEILALIEERQVELVILARYMQILSPSFTAQLKGKIINIHHSFLPSFKGAKPYHQAFERGVKIIGATAHYVTEDLDEGPIIEQELIRVDHSRSPEELVAIGHDIETQVLARAVKYHVEHRIFLNGHKTVIFR